jgi:hypothetical protein
MRKLQWGASRFAFGQWQDARRSMALLSACFCLAGCATSLTVPVQGRVLASDETFSGITTGRGDGTGFLEVHSSKGATCRGDFNFVTRSRGEGIFSCDDGRGGPFRFRSSGGKGYGDGSLGDQQFTFTFGNFD